MQGLWELLICGSCLYTILPNTLPTVLATAAIGFNNAVLAEAGMSYLGIGVQPPDASLGRMLLIPRHIWQQRPGALFFPEWRLSSWHWDFPC